MGKRIAVFLFGVVSYVLFFGTFLYAVGFVGNLVVPKAIDGEPVMPVLQALLINAGLLGVFAVQHSVMARKGFKRWITQFIPQAAERSVYVACASLALILMFTQWQPMGGSVWTVELPFASGILYAMFGLGWTIVLVTTFLINHFDLFGLRQVWLYLSGREYRPLQFRTPGPYRMVRHPLYLGFLLAFWATPTMTVAHFLFAIATTGYILVAIQLEERDLVSDHGRLYERYREFVPMIVPSMKNRTLQDMSEVRHYVVNDR